MLSLTRIVLGRAGSVAGDAAQGVVDGQVTAKTEVGQVSTAGVSTSESAPLVNTPSIAASILLRGRPSFIEPFSRLNEPRHACTPPTSQQTWVTEHIRNRRQSCLIHRASW
jgi:hypothetical protein